MNERLDAKMIRCCCDGELSPEQAAQMRERLECCQKTARAVEFERKLREHVGAVLKEECCPSSVCDCIRTALARSDADPAVIGRVGNARPRGWRLFSGTQHANFVAIAATLALIAGAVLFGIFGRTIDDVPPPQPLDMVSAAALYADEEHGLCSGDASYLNHKQSIASAEDAAAALTEWLGAPVSVVDLEEMGYQFIGAGQCGMPLPENARCAHLVYRKSADPAALRPMVSVFITPYRGGCSGMCQDREKCKWYPVAETDCRHQVMLSHDGKLMYFLVCCDDRDLEKVAQAVVQGQ